MTFESFGNFNLIAFDWIDVAKAAEPRARILIYEDAESVYAVVKNDDARRVTDELLDTEAAPERALYLFFAQLIRPDFDVLQKLEARISTDEDKILRGDRGSYLKVIAGYKRELLRMTRYYDQLGALFDELTANDNGIISAEGLRFFTILENRIERLRGKVEHLKEQVTQLRETYETEMDIEQNKFMKVFTVITSVFLPLSLIVGWYGMNFKNMPELEWPFGYGLITCICIVIAVSMLVIFKKKKWF